jgi:hypothetical protein
MAIETVVVETNVAPLKHKSPKGLKDISR